MTDSSVHRCSPLALFKYICCLTETGVHFQDLLPFGLGSAPHPLRVYSGATLSPLSRFAPFWLGVCFSPSQGSLRSHSGSTFKVCSPLAWGLLLFHSGFTLGPLKQIDPKGTLTVQGTGTRGQV